MFLAAFFAITAGAVIVLASSPFDIDFPIAELGNCANKTECKNYCDINGASSIQNNLPKSEINQKQGNWTFRLRVFDKGERYQLVIINNNGIGQFVINQADGTVYTAGNPPSCRGLQVYSTDQGRLPEHLPLTGTVIDCKTGEKTSFQIPEMSGGLDESERLERQAQCETFAAKHNLGNAAERAKEIAAIEADGGPGGCARGEDPRESCNLYCSSAEHMKECVDYAKVHRGIMSDEEIAEANKVIGAIESGVKLPDFCADDMRSCKDKCMSPESAETARQCFAFAKAAGLAQEDISEDDVEKMFLIMKNRGLTFRDMEKCRNEVSDTCIEVGMEAGFIKPEEAKMIKATGGKGPGGCRGKQECENFCNDETNQEICENFMADIINKNPELNLEELMSEDDRERMRRGIGEMREGLMQAPEEVRFCIKNEFPDLSEKIESGEFKPMDMMKIGRQMKPVMEKCFQQMMFDEEQVENRGESEEGEGRGVMPSAEEKQVGLQECFQQVGMDYPPTRPPTEGESANLQECMKSKFTPPENSIRPEVSAPTETINLREEIIKEQIGEQIQERLQEEYLKKYQEECVLRGGVWSGTGCETPTLDDTKLQLPESEKIQNPAGECEIQGGKWNGESCVFGFRFSPRAFLGFLSQNIMEFLSKSLR